MSITAEEFGKLMDFATFINSVNEDIQLGIVKSKYDEVFEDTKYDNYLIEKNIT